MPTKRVIATTLADFFDGVAEMRAHLDRDKMRRGRDQLARMALDLTKSRSAEALGLWLCEGLTRALEARGAAIVLLQGATHFTQTRYGFVEHQPTAPELATAAETAALQHEPVVRRGGLVAALVGTDRPYGALWIEHDGPLDAELAPLLCAVIDAGAVTLEALLQLPRFALEMVP